MKYFKYFSYFFSENRFWHFIQIVTWNVKFCFLVKISRILQLVVCWIVYPERWLFFPEALLKRSHNIYFHGEIKTKLPYQQLWPKNHSFESDPLNNTASHTYIKCRHRSTTQGVRVGGGGWGGSSKLFLFPLWKLVCSKWIEPGLGGSVGCAVWRDQEVTGSTPAEVGNILSWRLIWKYFLWSFFPFHWFKKGSSFSGKRMCTILVTA